MYSDEISRGGLLLKNFTMTGLIHQLRIQHPKQHKEYSKFLESNHVSD